MAGQLDTALKNIAKQVVAQLGDSLDTTIVYTRKGVSSYDNTTGQYITVDTNYTIKVPIEFVRSTEETGFQENVARLYITPDLIGDNQPTFDDEVTITYAGSTRVGQIINIDTKQGGQTYLFTLLVRL